MTALSPTSSSTPADAAGPSRARQALLWTAFLVAFSPVLVDLARHQIETPWSRYSALFVVLLLISAWRSHERAAPSRDGAVWLAVGAALALIAVGGGMPRLARPGVALAAVGLGRMLGHPPLAALALVIWAVPVPHNVMRLGSPMIEAGLFEAGALLVSPLGLDLLREGSVATLGTGSLELHETDGGLPLLALLSGLGYYAGLRAGLGIGARLLRALSWGLLAVPIQIVGVALALLLLATGADTAARAWLTHGVWMMAAAGGVLLAERGAPAAAKPA